ncbi:MAG: hypothetical protein LBL66_08110 [Clostridiales bacterium]|nr:hypothetical protein [Clostridiales bacterium]
MYFVFTIIYSFSIHSFNSSQSTVHSPQFRSKFFLRGATFTVHSAQSTVSVEVLFARCNFHSAQSTVHSPQLRMRV